MGRKIILTEEQEKIVKDSYLSGMSCNQILKIQDSAEMLLKDV